MELLERTMGPSATAIRDDRIEEVYEKAFPAFARFAANRHASFAEAKDIFHDAMVLYHEKCQSPEFAVHISPEAYVVGIAKHLWIRRFHRDKKYVSLTDAESSIEIPSDYYPTVNETRLLKFVESTGKRCLELLQKFYYENASLHDIAATLGFRNEHSAAVRKFKCIEKMRNAIRSKSIGYEDFLE